ncbi:MAG: toll/interleukin-1 receptor domain-containing protein [Steroidobacteraceae bacterium]
MTTPLKYRAFISYSHSDEKWAQWLHRSLETYRLPRHLVGTQTEFGPVPERFTPVFRDRDELATATNLGATLINALEQSACQIVICSPKAAQSRWVNEEILTFRRLGREHRVFCLIVAGEPGASTDPRLAELECFPRALIHKLGADGQLTAERSEPIAADVRPQKDRKHDALLKLLAGMLGIGLDELKRREARRRQRRMLALVSVSVAGMVITSTLAAAAWIARNEAERQRIHAENEARTARRVTGFIVDMFKIVDPSEARGSEITAQVILDKGAARIDAELADEPAVQATLMDTMATLYTSLGLYRSAIPLARRSVDKRRLLAGDNDVVLAESLGHLGEALARTADYAEAAKRLEEALVIQRATLGRWHADVANTLAALADVMSYTGEYARGQQLIEEALQIRRRLYGEVHADVAQSLGDLGVNFGERGDFNQAELHLRQALELQRELHGDLHPDLAEAMNNLAWAMQGLGRFDQAEPLHREALDMNRKLLPAVHPELAVGLNNVAFDLEMRDDYRGAEKAYRESLEMNRKLYDDESHPDIATGMSNLAFVLDAKGDRPGAIQLLRESIDMSRRELGPEHPDVAGGATNLANWLTAAGEYEEASQLLDEALAIRRKALGNEHPQVASTLSVQANLLIARESHAEALEAATEALRILTLSLPDDHWQVAMAKNAQGAALTGLGQYRDAEKLLLASLPALAGSPIPDLPQHGRARLAKLYAAWGKPEEAAKYSR